MENFDYEEYKRRARIAESSGNDRAVSAADAKGRYQFLESTWRDLGMGGKDIYDPKHQEEAMRRFTQNNVDQFKRKYKREPDYVDVYGMHHLGFTGYTRTIDDPNAPVSKYYNEKALAANPHFERYGTMGNLRKHFANRMNENNAEGYQTDGSFQYTHSRPTPTENYLPENAFQMEGRSARQVSPIDGRYTKEEKEEEDNLSRKNEAKIRLLEQEIANRQQQQPTTNPYEVEKIQPVQQPQQPTYSYLSNTDLFRINDTPVMQDGGIITPKQVGDAKEWLTNWYSTERATNMLKRQGEISPRTRLDNLNTVVINYEEIPDEAGIIGAYLPDTHQIDFRRDDMGLNYVPLHELTHASTRGYNNFPQTAYEEISRRVSGTDEYQTDPTEIHSKINSFRKFLQEKSIYDAFNVEFSQEHLDSVNRDEIDSWRDVDVYELLNTVNSDEDLIWLMNNIAYNPQASRQNTNIV